MLWRLVGESGKFQRKWAMRAIMDLAILDKTCRWRQGIKKLRGTKLEAFIAVFAIELPRMLLKKSALLGMLVKFRTLTVTGSANV